MASCSEQDHFKLEMYDTFQSLRLLDSQAFEDVLFQSEQLMSLSSIFMLLGNFRFTRLYSMADSLPLEKCVRRTILKGRKRSKFHERLSVFIVTQNEPHSSNGSQTNSDLLGDATYELQDRGQSVHLLWGDTLRVVVIEVGRVGGEGRLLTQTHVVVVE